MTTALVTGALGLVGAHLCRELAAAGWRTVGVARTERAAPGEHRHLALDLRDGDACERHLGPLASEVSHVFFAARASEADAAREVETNLAMLCNTLQALDRPEGALRHVAVVHGTKWYGSHLGPYRTPAREGDPRCDSPVYYHAQQDLLASRQPGRAWSWSALRPHIVLGVAHGYPHNCIVELGAYGSLCAALGLPLAFPGTRAAFESISQATEAGLLARATIWSATTPHARNEAYNVINGDYFRWSNVWPRVAAFFGIAAAPPAETSVAHRFAECEALWQRLAAQHNLRVSRLADLANGAFLDFLFKAGWDDLSSVVKLRRHGFHETLDTEDTILSLLAMMRAERLIP